MSEFLWIIIESTVKAIIILTLIMLVYGALGVYLERKISAWIQNRIGPNRVGPFGLLQPFADVLKLFLKEDLVPTAANPIFHRLAPIITLGVAVAVYAVIPFGDYVTIAGRNIQLGLAPNTNIAILFVLAMTSVGVYGITLGGWSSNNKYSLLGALRSTAQMISYELSMGLALVGVLMITGTLSVNEMVIQQSNFHWNILYQPFGFILFLIASFAETNRAPFDLPEAEPELVGGYNTEYSGMKFGMFFLAEYANMGTSSAIMVLLYFGGWQTLIPAAWLGLEPGSIGLALLQFASFLIKIELMVLFFIWVRWSLPRFRYDQLMNLGWKVLLPLAIANVAVTGFVLMFIK